MSPTKASDSDGASAKIDAKIQELGDWRGETLSHLRDLIHAADPDVTEEWKWEKPKSADESYKATITVTATTSKGAPITTPSA